MVPQGIACLHHLRRVTTRLWKFANKLQGLESTGNKLHIGEKGRNWWREGSMMEEPETMVRRLDIYFRGLHMVLSTIVQRRL